MTRLAAILSLLVVRAALADDAVAPQTARPEPLSEARKALVERAQAPLQAARLPMFGVDPLRTVPGTAKAAPHLMQAPGPGGRQGGPGHMPPMGAGRARDAADRAAERAIDGDGRGGHGHDGGHDGHGHGGRRDGHDGHDGPDGRNDGQPPPPGSPPPPHPP